MKAINSKAQISASNLRADGALKSLSSSPSPSRSAPVPGSMDVNCDLCASQDNVAGQGPAAESDPGDDVELSYLALADHAQSMDVKPGGVDRKLDIARLTDLYDSLFLSVSSGCERRCHEHGCVSAGGSVGAADSSSALLSISRNSLISGQLDKCCELNLDLDESGRKVGAVECFLSAALRLNSQSKLTIKSAADEDFTLVCNCEQGRSSSELTAADMVSTLNHDSLNDAGTESAAAAAELSSPAPAPDDLSAAVSAAVSLSVPEAVSMSAAVQTADSDCACDEQEQPDESTERDLSAEDATAFELCKFTDAYRKAAHSALMVHDVVCESALDCKESAILSDSRTDCPQALHDSALGADDESYLICSCSNSCFYGLQTADPYSDHDLLAVDEFYGCTLLSGEPGHQPVTGAEAVTGAEPVAVIEAGAETVPVSAAVSGAEEQSAAARENSTLLLQLPEGLCSAGCVSPSALSTTSCAHYLNDSTGRHIQPACIVSHCPVMSGVDEGSTAAIVNDDESNHSIAWDASCAHSHGSQLEHSCDNSQAQGRFTEPATGGCTGAEATEHKEKIQFCAESQNVLDTESLCALKYFIKSDNAADLTADNKESHHLAALHGGCAAGRACTSDLKVAFAPQAFTSSSGASGSDQDQTAAPAMAKAMALSPASASVHTDASADAIAEGSAADLARASAAVTVQASGAAALAAASAVSEQPDAPGSREQVCACAGAGGEDKGSVAGKELAVFNRRRSFQGSRWWGGVLKVCNKLLQLADCAGINTSVLRSRIGRLSVQA